MNNYKFIYQNYYENKVSIKDFPKKPDRYKYKEIFYLDLQDDYEGNRTNLLDVCQEAIKKEVLLCDVEFNIDEKRLKFYKRIENKDYPLELLGYEEDITTYQNELLIYNDLKKKELEDKKMNEREIKLKQLKKLQEELGV